MAQGFYGNGGAPEAQVPQNYQPQQFATQSPIGSAPPQWVPNGNKPATQNLVQPGPPTAPQKPTVMQSGNGAAKAKPRVEEAAARDAIVPAGLPTIPGVSPQSYTGARISASRFGRTAGRSADAADRTRTSGQYQRDRVRGSQFSRSAGSFGSGWW